MDFSRVYITGCDCTGKSTIAQGITDATGIPITKFSKPETYEGDALDRAEFERLASSQEDCILDRAWNGRYAYEGILDQMSNVLPLHRILEYSVELSKEFTDNGGTIIMTHASHKSILRRLHDRGDDFIKPYQIYDIIERYKHIHKAYLNAGVPFYFVDTSHL